jgi:ubiquinone biosynthesis protein UbiJ
MTDDELRDISERADRLAKNRAMARRIILSEWDARPDPPGIVDDICADVKALAAEVERLKAENERLKATNREQKDALITLLGEDHPDLI